jgi:hypothetical protein
MAQKAALSTFPQLIDNLLNAIDNQGQLKYHFIVCDPQGGPALRG